MEHFSADLEKYNQQLADIKQAPVGKMSRKARRKRAEGIQIYPRELPHTTKGLAQRHITKPTKDTQSLQEIEAQDWWAPKNSVTAEMISFNTDSTRDATIMGLAKECNTEIMALQDTRTTPNNDRGLKWRSEAWGRRAADVEVTI